MAELKKPLASVAGVSDLLESDNIIIVRGSAVRKVSAGQLDLSVEFAVDDVGNATIGNGNFSSGGSSGGASVVTTDSGLNTPGAAADAKATGDAIQELRDLLYKEIEITRLSVSPALAELGSTVSNLSFTFGFSREPTQVTLAGKMVNTSATQMSIADAGLTADKTYTLTATDEKGKATSRSVTVKFCNGVYWGVSASTNVTSSLISGLSKELLTSRKKTFTVNAGATQYIYFALPTSYGTPNFNVKGFDGGFEKVASLSYTNPSNYTESYDVWRSDNVGLGSTTVVVS